jgi:hypothetical protein
MDRAASSQKGDRMAATEDELAKQRVQEAIWTWAGRFLTALVIFGGGFFSAWYMYARGAEGAPALRERVVQLDSQILELKNKRVDVEGKLVVVQSRLDECNKNLAAAASRAATPPPAATP